MCFIWMSLWGGNLDDVVHDLVLFDRVAAELGLSLNQQKSEVICEEEHIYKGCHSGHGS